VWAGAGISTFNPDYGCKDSSPFTCWDHQLLGITAFGDANHIIFQRLGVEGEMRFMPWKGPGGLDESSYLAGPRIGLLRYRRLMFSGKVLIGAGHISLSNHNPANGTYFAFAPGAIIDYKLTNRLVARGEYEYQIWPSFTGYAPGTPSAGSGGLTPNGFSVGISYAFLK
jgi:opacity protein-like surface antigen